MNLFKDKRWVLLMLLALTLLLAACSGGGNDDTAGDTDTDTDGAEEGTAGENAEGGDGGDLIVAVLSDASSLDPHGSNDVPSLVVQNNIYETLVKRDENNEIVAGLAESWEQVDDTTWSFTLHEGIQFHDGEEFNAEVVKMNLDRIRDEAVASPRFFLFAMITEVEVVDEYEVHITTEYPFAPLLAHLTHLGGGMISPAAIEADYEALEGGSDPGSVISQNPVGTGFFEFDSWDVGDQIRLVRNDNYWADGAKVDSVTFRVVPDSQVRAADLETGNVHIIDPVQPNEVERINNTGVATVLQTPASSFAYLAFNHEKEPFDNPLVRRAISLAVDREAIISGIYDDYGIPAIGPLAPGVFGYTDQIDAPEYNIEEARALLEEAGMADGFSTTIYTNDSPQRQATAVLVQESLAELNIDVAIEVLEFGTYLDLTASGDQEMFVLGWSNPTGDADYGMFGPFHSSQKGGAGNRSRYENAEVDELLERGRQETDPAVREEIYAEAAQLLNDDAAMVFLLHTEFLNGISNNVSGFAIDSAGIFQLKDVTINE